MERLGQQLVHRCPSLSSGGPLPRPLPKMIFRLLLVDQVDFEGHVHVRDPRARLCRAHSVFVVVVVRHRTSTRVNMVVMCST